MKNKLLKLLI